MAKYVKIKYRNKTLLKRVKYCNTFFSRLRGLMFSRKPDKKEGLLIVLNRESREFATIHMFFVFFSIDVFWLDSDLKVVDVEKDVHPFESLVKPKRKAKYVLEVSSGAIEKGLLGKKLKIA